ncbi:hypothetical protein ACF3OC_08490 [Sphingobacterium cellulitidis]|uniref:hypothetical protein n=1 Tax=Sphingobacterium cellulitidis TaxID=1768011 RepID=UPI000B9438E6|nr:hypothetical protein CHT99_10395 [Sphingobacterium cellulitidis]
MQKYKPLQSWGIKKEEMMHTYSVILAYFLEGEMLQWEKKYYTISENGARQRALYDYGSEFSILSVRKLD